MPASVLHGIGKRSEGLSVGRQYASCSAPWVPLQYIGPQTEQELSFSCKPCPYLVPHGCHCLSKMFCTCT